MKFKTRDKLLTEYNNKYNSRIADSTERLAEYFKKRGWNLEKACEKARKKALEIINEREYETIDITLYEYPMKTDRPRTFAGHTFSPNAAANKSYFNKALKQVVKAVKLITTPSEIEIEAYLEMPAQVKPDEVLLFESKLLNVVDMPDYDNIGKCYTDMLKDNLIIDDDLFYRGTIVKYYSVLPRVHIRITSLTKHESDYIYKKIKGRKSIKVALMNGQVELKKIKKV